MHEQRIEAVFSAVMQAGARTVLDLGCGDGDLFLRLSSQPAISRLLGIDICSHALARLEQRLAKLSPPSAEVEFRVGSMTEAHPALAGFDCAVLVETIEHIKPSDLSQLERAVFGQMRPRTVVITTPNAEFNVLLGVPAHRFRHPDHRFEWPRSKFRHWGDRVANAHGYEPHYQDIAGCHPELGGASQMAVFTICCEGSALSRAARPRSLS